ncbi:phage terminase large subunit family protein [Escherichia coli]|uniref:terminase gpA endonuclease subunit n=1 Tax=Escherichia coli TaxID=562 RepID=UPI0026652EBC|nr:terminase gpA endonuclease subunit [Escherichia coli]MCA7705965.1 phage terminase large subunit family protein [Escherichia coli]MDO2666276.1 phage terminase large subunit family protein [Escherichia coli]UCT18485.1 phage terminase large subunit family protein [Escherichia coli]HDP9624463.1 phage terminase large subunit family protein [Escherichia coli]
MNNKKLMNILRKAKTFLMPPPDYTPSEWIENNLIFPDGPYSGQPMRLFEFQKEMIDVVKERKKKIVMMTSAQIGKTTILNGVLFYKSATDPGNAGVLQSTGKETTQWLSGKIRPMIDASEEMQKIVTDKNDRNAVNNTSQIQLRNGGFWYFMSLNSPSHLRGKTLPLLLLDEVDAVETDTEEGNPIMIAEQRATTFGDDARVFICSTPTGRYGAINTQYETSDKRKYHVPCPKCGHSHELVWENVKFEWIKQDGKSIPDPDSAFIQCPMCEHKITEGERARAIKKGEWIQTNPESNVVGFHVSRLYSPMSSIKSVVEDFKQAFQTFSLSTFYNTVLGLPFDDLNEELESSKLEALKTDISIRNIPEDTMFITAGVDQQQDRLEITLMGHNEKTVYILDHRSFMTMNAEVIDSPAYKELLAYIRAPFKTPSGRKVPVAWVNVDSSNGRATKTIYRFCSQWTNLKAIKGASSVDAPYVPTKVTKTGGYELYMIGVNQGKNLVRELLNRTVKSPNTTPVRVEISDDVPDDYCEQLMSEELKRSGNTVRWVIKQGGVRNEGLDCFNYGYCARLQVLEKIKWHEWRKMTAKSIVSESEEESSDDIEVQTVEDTTERTKRPPTRPIVRPFKKKRGWLN